MINREQCIVCGDDTHHTNFGAPPLCGQAECHHVLNEKHRLPPELFDRFLATRSKLIKDRKRRERERRALFDRANALEAEENERYRQAKTANLKGYDPNQYPLLAVPRNDRKTATLPERRKRAFRDRLNKIISTVMETPDAIYTGTLLPDAPPPSAKILGGACSLCRGACCIEGGNHAYLRELTIIRIMREQPSLPPRHLLEAYMEHLGKKTIAGGCVFQGESGCLLPRPLRSNTCEDYYCLPLKQYKEAFDANPKPEGAVVVVRAREHWCFPAGVENGIAGAYLVTENGSTPLE